MVIIDEKGISNNLMGAVHFIAWDEIEEIIIYNMRNQKWVGIVAVNYEQIYNRQSSLKKWWVNLNSTFVQPFTKKLPVMNVPETLLPCSALEFTSLVESYKIHSKSAQGL